MHGFTGIMTDFVKLQLVLNMQFTWNWKFSKYAGYAKELLLPCIAVETTSLWELLLVPWIS